MEQKEKESFSFNSYTHMVGIYGYLCQSSVKWIFLWKDSNLSN